jgi:hypothetical protein
LAVAFAGFADLGGFAVFLGLFFAFVDMAISLYVPRQARVSSARATDT